MIYMDSAATVPPTASALKDYVNVASGAPLNPSSVYGPAYKAKTILAESRGLLAKLINCDDDEVVFTSGGTEGNNMIIRGWRDGILSNKQFGKRNVFITTPIEHPSILEPLYHLLENDDRFRVYRIPVLKNGEIDKKSFEETIEIESKEAPDLNLMVSIQFVNNEIGTCQPIKELAALTHKYNGFFHTDAVQAFPHFKIDVSDFGIDAMTVSGHKFGGLRGTGFIYLSHELQRVMKPMIRGGQQEMGLRAGTENVAGAYSLAKRVYELYFEIPHTSKGDYLLNRLDESGINYKVNGRHDVDIYSLTVYAPSSQLVTLLGEDGICVSAGSACHNYSPEPSHVLKAIGLSDDDAKSTIRVCLDCATNEEIDLFIEKLEFYVGLLRSDAEWNVRERGESSD